MVVGPAGTCLWPTAVQYGGGGWYLGVAAAAAASCRLSAVGKAEDGRSVGEVVVVEEVRWEEGVFSTAVAPAPPTSFAGCLLEGPAGLLSPVASNPPLGVVTSRCVTAPCPGLLDACGDLEAVTPGWVDPGEAAFSSDAGFSSSRRRAGIGLNGFRGTSVVAVVFPRAGAGVWHFSGDAFSEEGTGAEEAGPLVGRNDWAPPPLLSK